MFQPGPTVSIDVAPPDDLVFGGDGEYLNTIVLNDAQNERRDRVRGRRFEQKQIRALASHAVESSPKRGGVPFRGINKANVRRSIAFSHVRRELGKPDHRRDAEADQHDLTQ